MFRRLVITPDCQIFGTDFSRPTVAVPMNTWWNPAVKGVQAATDSDNTVEKIASISLKISLQFCTDDISLFISKCSHTVAYNN